MSNSSSQACMEEFVAAMIRKDMTALALLTDDVVFFYSNGSALWGKDAFRSTMSANWKLIDNYHYRTLESVWMAQSADTAALTYTFSWSGVAGGRTLVVAAVAREFSGGILWAGASPTSI